MEMEIGMRKFENLRPPTSRLQSSPVLLLVAVATIYQIFFSVSCSTFDKRGKKIIIGLRRRYPIKIEPKVLKNVAN